MTLHRAIVAEGDPKAREPRFVVPSAIASRPYRSRYAGRSSRRDRSFPTPSRLERELDTNRPAHRREEGCIVGNGSAPLIP